MSVKCLFCESEVNNTRTNGDMHFIQCPLCGKYSISHKAITFPDSLQGEYDFDKVASYLYYNKNDNRTPIFLLDNDSDKEDYLSPDEINNWYPNTFAEKIDMMLLALSKKCNYFGDTCHIDRNEFISLAFLKRTLNKSTFSSQQEQEQIKFICKYVSENNLVGVDTRFQKIQCCIESEGWKRIDDLQKKINENAKTVFVAMSFAAEMKPVEDAIRSAILNCGFVPMIIKDKEYNRQIVPEILYEIRQAKFVIAEFTTHNNGAYYEAGYALALGKEVIHLCKRESFEEDAHFDVKQVNTIRWSSIEELEEKLIKRIKATIS